MDSSTDRTDDSRQRGTTESISERVVSAVADARGVDPLQLAPLYEVVDPDALDSLFQGASTETDRVVGRAVFSMAGCEVVVHSSGDIDVTAPNEVPSASGTAGGTEWQATESRTD